GLCEVRRAFTPIARMIWSWRSIARVFTAAPKAPRSWCRHTPRIFTGRPFRKNPESALKTNDSTPNGVVYVSQPVPAPDARYGAIEIRPLDRPEDRQRDRQ